MKWYADVPDLDIDGFKHVGNKHIKLYKGGGGSQTVTQVSSPPKVLLPYLVDAVKEAQKVAALPYVPYGGQRIAEFSPEQLAVQSGVMSLQTPGAFVPAISGAQATGGLGYSAAQRGLEKALGFTPGTFGEREAQYYMSPYQQNVTNIALREAQRAADMERKKIGLEAGKSAAAYGGSAKALQEAELARNLLTTRGDIQARGSQAAFEAAQQQFERDRASALAGAGLGGQMGTAGLGTSLQSSLALGELGGAQQRADLARLEAQRAIGQQVQDQRQKFLSQEYQDFLAQRGYPREQTAFLLDAIRGTSPLFGMTQQTTQPAPNLLAQLGGIGAGIYGLNKAGAFAEGGEVKENKLNSGLAKLALHKVLS